MKGKRTGLEFDQHVFTAEDAFPNPHESISVYSLKIPDRQHHCVRFIVGYGITTATGDFGEWVFGKELHPHAGGGISDSYIIGKLCTHDSGSTGEEFDPEATREIINEMLTPEWQLENLDRELTYEEEEYLNDCNDATFDGCEFAYLAVAYRQNTGWFEDSESVPYVKKTKRCLLTVFDAFDEMCRRLKENEQ